MSADLRELRERISCLEQEIDHLNSAVRPNNPALYEALALPYYQQIQTLRAQMDEALGLEAVQADFVMRLTGGLADQHNFEGEPLVQMVSKVAAAVMKSIGQLWDETYPQLPWRQFGKDIKGPRVVAVYPSSFSVGFARPLTPTTLFTQDAHQIVERAIQRTIECAPALTEVSKVNTVSIPRAAARLLIDVSRIAQRNDSSVHLYSRVESGSLRHVTLPKVPRQPRQARKMSLTEVRGVMRECDLDLGRFIVRKDRQELLKVRFDREEFEELISKAFDCEVRVEVEVELDSTGKPRREGKMVDFEQVSTNRVPED